MARILVISSQVVFGPVGLNAIVPPLQSQGHDVLAIPTVFLSNHPGHGKAAGRSTTAEELSAIIATLENLGALNKLDAIITGYFASPEQIKIIANLIRKLNCKIVMIDPVLGHHGKLYVPEIVARSLAAELLPLATIATPNAFELSWLTNLPVTDETTSKAEARKLNLASTLVTSVPLGPAQLQTILLNGNRLQAFTTPRLENVPHGTGDMLAGLYLSHLLSDPKTALENALTILNRAIALSGDSHVLAVAEALYENRISK